MEWNGRAADNEAADRQRNSALGRLANDSLWYLQVKEALGRPPELKEFGIGRFEWPSAALANTIEDAWLIYRSTIEGAE